MVFSRISLRLMFGIMPFFLFSGCGDLEPEMQDTRTVVLKMDFNQRSTSRNSSVSQAEVSSHKTHLIFALPVWENLSNNYKNYYSSFAQELMNPSNNKVSLKIPLNTQMKIFAFLFKDDYTMPQLFSGLREVGYYGESQPFSIGKNTNNLSLAITLQSKGTTTGDSNDNGNGGGEQGGTDSTADTTAPTVSVTPANITSSGFALVKSTETGFAYLVNTAITVSNLSSITGATDNQWNRVTISSANTNTELPATGLVDGTYKAYAVDAASNLSNASLDNVTIVGLADIDGNVYGILEIGTQRWMAENLKVTKYRNGVDITKITNNDNWTSNTNGAYAYYSNITANIDTYGMLYNWYAVDNSSSRYICPQGWHVPTADEFDVLSTYLGGNSVAGGKIKEPGTDYWNSPNTVSDNESSGFNARGTGYRLNNGNYGYLKQTFVFWTVSENSNSNAYYRAGSNSSGAITAYHIQKKYGFSVRCLKD